jgi:hypothetical protein
MQSTCFSAPAWLGMAYEKRLLAYASAASVAQHGLRLQFSQNSTPSKLGCRATTSGFLREIKWMACFFLREEYGRGAGRVADDAALLGCGKSQGIGFTSAQLRHSCIVNKP